MNCATMFVKTDCLFQKVIVKILIKTVTNNAQFENSERALTEI